MLYYVRLRDDRHHRRWRVREALSLDHALTAVRNAMAFGCVGMITRRVEMTSHDGLVLADVVQVNSDNSERRPYTEAY